MECKKGEDHRVHHHWDSNKIMIFSFIRLFRKSRQLSVFSGSVVNPSDEQMFCLRKR
jgi:hypothetical protein